MMEAQAQDPGRRPAQRKLAEEMVVRIHGADVGRSVVEASRLLFGATDLGSAGADVLAVLAGELPTTRLPEMMQPEEMTESSAMPLRSASANTNLAGGACGM